MALPPRGQIAQILQGAGAGIRGGGQEFIQGIDDNRKKALLEDAFTIQGQLQNADISGARNVLLSRIDTLAQVGGDDTDSVALLAKLESGDIEGALSDVATVVSFAEKQGLLPGAAQTASQREFESLTANLTPEKTQEAREIKLGIRARAVGSAAQTIAATETTELVGESEAEIAGMRATATEAAKLTVRARLEPEVALNVQNVLTAAKVDTEIAAENRSNVVAFDLYDVAIRQLAAGLEGSFAGPIAGLIPALTASAQIADGAVAAMAPILKQMFRAAGEGIFTDKDQELLLAMIPTRTSTPEARAVQLANIDAIVRAKLASRDVSGARTQGGGPVTQNLSFDPTTGTIQ